MTTHTARIDYECNAEEFWDAFRANLRVLDQSCELCRRCRELLDDDVTTFRSEFDYQSFVGYASAFVGWGSGPAHAKNPIVFVESDEDDEDEEDEPKREKYITINDDPDYWGSVEPDFDLDEEIAKITNAADDAGIVVYDGDKPSQETIDTGIEIDWFSEWCTVADSWSESQWVEWFRKQ